MTTKKVRMTEMQKTATPRIADLTTKVAPKKVVPRKAAQVAATLTLAPTVMLQVKVARIDGRTTLGGVWIPVEAFGDHALPTLTRKVVRHVMAHLGPSGQRY